MKAYLFCDAGMIFNKDKMKGTTSSAFILLDRNKKIIKEHCSIQKNQTTPHAEIKAIQEGLKEALIQEVKKIKIFSDSEFAIKSLKGQYSPTEKNNVFIVNETKELLNSFKEFSLNHIPRSKNVLADLVSSIPLEKLRGGKKKVVPREEAIVKTISFLEKFESKLEEKRQKEIEKAGKKAVEETNEELRKERNSKPEYIKYLLGQEKPEFKSLGCGIYQNQNEEEFMYFGTKIYNGTYGMDGIITSDGKLYFDDGENNQIKQLGINYKFPFFDSVLDYSWSNNSTPYSITDFCFEEKKLVTVRECYEDNYTSFKRYMDYQDEMIYVSKSCDIESSFYLPVFEAKGRTFDNAEKGSGKTRGAMIYDRLMFNPVMSADISGASYFRIIESTSASIIVDDFDAVEEEKKQAQIQIMRTGYKRGQKAIRVSETKKRIPETFNLFNSMLVNNVGGLDEVTADRCNTYQLIKSTNKKISDKKLNLSNKNWQVMMDKKYYCALLNWKKVKEVYEFLEVEGISGRDLEKIAPILTIGKLVLNNETYEKLLEYEKNKLKEQRDKDVSQDWLFMFLKKVVWKMQNLSEIEKESGIWYRLDELVNELCDENFDREHRDFKKTKRSISIYVGKKLKNTPLFKSGKVHGGYVRHLYISKNLLKFLEIKGYLDFFRKEELQNLSIQSIQPNPSIQSIQSIPIEKNKEIKRNNSGEYGEYGEKVIGVNNPEKKEKIIFSKEEKKILEDFE